MRPCRAFGNPSYHVQALFAQHQGVLMAQTSVDSRALQDNGVAASATCADRGCSRLSLKVRITLADAIIRLLGSTNNGQLPLLQRCVLPCASLMLHACLHPTPPTSSNTESLPHSAHIGENFSDVGYLRPDVCVVQLVNYAAFPQTVALSVLGAPSGLGGPTNITTLAAIGPYVTNSFDKPCEVGDIPGGYNAFALICCALSA